MREELVSIVIPLYNYEKYCKYSIESALNQTYKNKEIIVLDNCSTDNSLNIARKYEKMGVHIVCNEKNIGIVGNYIKATRVCKGKYIVILGADDILEETYLEKTVSVMEQNNKVGMVVASSYKLNENGKKEKMVNFYEKSFVCQGVYQAKVFMFTNAFIPSQVLIRKSCLEDKEVGTFSERLSYAFDTDLWFRICLKYDFAFLKDELVGYRIHMTSAGHNYDNLEVAIEYYLMRLRFAGLVKNSSYLNNYVQESIRRSSAMSIRIVRNLLQHNKKDMVENHLYFAVAINPTMIYSQIYNYILEVLRGDKIFSLDLYIKYEQAYIDTLMSDESRKIKKTAPYDYPLTYKMLE